MTQIDIATNKLVVSTLNARKDLQSVQEDSGIDELASSIRQQGLLSPLIVRPTVDDQFEVLTGQRRLLACRKIGLDPIPCIVRTDLGDSDAVTISLMENIHRADMHPLDKARSLKALYDRHQSYDRVARETAWSVSTVRKYIQLLDLPEGLQARLGTASGPAGVGTLARLAQTFSGDDGVHVYDRISGFTQRIQEEILKRSDGDLAAIDNLIDEAQEGAFDTRRSGGLYGCEVIRDILERRLSQDGFQKLVGEIAQTHSDTAHTDRAREEAVRGFWKALGKG